MSEIKHDGNPYDRPDNSANHHGARPYWKRAHRSVGFWIAIILMLAAMAIYVMSDDLGEVLMDGDHTLERCRKVSEEALRNVFIQLNCQRVLLEGMILKPNMVLPGLTCPAQECVDEVADVTVRSLLRTVPAAVPGIAFLSGGQSSELASARLNSMNVRFKSRLPWALAFSFARAIQQPALDVWQGQEANILSAQKALLLRARCNQAARRGEYTPVMERPQA